MDRLKTLNLYRHLLGLSMWGLASLLVLFNSGLAAAEAEAVEYRFERMWPNNDRWYFDGLIDVAVAADGSVYGVDNDNHRIVQFSAAGTFLRTWGSLGSANGEFDGPRGIAVAPDGTVYVADTWNHRIQRFSATGTFLEIIGIFGNGNGEFDAPGGIAIAPDGTVYVVDRRNYRIQRFNATGTFLGTWGSEGSANGEFYKPEGITVALDGTVYVADSANNRIQQFSATGTFIGTWGGYGSAIGEFDGPTGIAVAPDGTVYVADTNNRRIQQFNATGTFLSVWGEGSATGEFYGPGDIAFASDGTAYVADWVYNRVLKFGSTGDLIAVLGSGGAAEGQFLFPVGIAVAPDGTVYVADTDNNRIQQFSATGTLLRTWGGYGHANGEFNRPEGVAVAPDGTVYVADRYNHRIQQFSADGTFLGVVGSLGDQTGELNWPADIAFDTAGQLYVVERTNNRVQVFTPANTSVVVDGTPQTPRALIIAGRTAAGDTLDTTILSIAVRRAYSALRAQGYRDDAGHEEIRVLWNGPPISLPSGNLLPTLPVTTADFSAGSALTQWAQGTERLLVYVVGHGDPGYFYLDAATRETLTAEALDGWLDLVQPTLADDITLIYEACYAGSFIDPLAGPNRVLLTSADAEQRALFLNYGLNSYSYSLWTDLEIGKDLKGAHEKATLDMQVRRGSPQTPQLEADGNAVANEKDDLQLAVDRCIGIGVDSSGNLMRECKVAASPVPRILQVAPPQSLEGETGATLWLELDPTQATSIVDAWAVITRPDFQPDPNQSFDRLPVVTFSPDPVLGKARWIGRYAPGVKSQSGETYQGFDVVGEYDIAYYVKNSGGLLSSPMPGSVTQYRADDGGTQVTISGTVRNPSGTPLCAMVLANGKYMFSCDGQGSYALTVPLDENGEVTLFSFVDGYAPYKTHLAPTGDLIQGITQPTPGPGIQALTVTWSTGATTAPGRTLIGGQVSANGAPVCALVLANGQYMFSCDGFGQYSLEVPLVGNGEITLMVFADGFLPFKKTVRP